MNKLCVLTEHKEAMRASINCGLIQVLKMLILPIYIESI